MGTQELAFGEEVVTLVCQAFRDILAFQVSRGIVGFRYSGSSGISVALVLAVFRNFRIQWNLWLLRH